MNAFNSIKRNIRLQIICNLAVALLLASCSNPESDFKRAEQFNTEQAYNDFIKKHPDSPLVAQAKVRIEQNAYEATRKTGNVAALEVFLNRFQSKELAQKTRIELETLEFAQASKSLSIPTWETFLQNYPKSTNASRARQELAQLVFQKVLTTNTVSAYEAFTMQFAGTEAVKEAVKRIELLEYQSATNANDITTYQHFLERHPLGDLTPDVKARLEPQLEDRDWNQALLENDASAFRRFLTKHPNSPNVRIIEVTIEAGFVFYEWAFWSPRDLDDAKRLSDASNGAIGVALQSEQLAIYPLTISRAHKMGLVPSYGESNAGGLVAFAAEAPTPSKRRVLCVKDGTKYRIVDLEGTSGLDYKIPVEHDKHSQNSQKTEDLIKQAQTGDAQAQSQLGKLEYYKGHYNEAYSWGSMLVSNLMKKDSSL